MKKLLFLFSLSTLYLLLSTRVVLGAVNSPGGTWYAQPPDAWSQKVFQTTDQGEVFQERYVSSIVTNIMNLGISIGRGTTTYVAEGPNGPIYSYSGGVFGGLIDIATGMAEGPPVSSGEYIAYIGSSLGVVKPAYAQGLGFSSFSPILSIWKICRDIAYLGFVVIFVVIGLMVMFRRKIDPRTVVTIQDALPRIVVALVLVTFSYAIAGVIIDAGELTTRLIGNTLADNKLIASTTGAAQKDQTKLESLLNANSFTLTETMRNPGKFADILWSGTLQQAFGTNQVPGPIQWLLSITTSFILTIAGIFIAFKIFFSLLTPYVTVILYVIFAPFMLMMSALPGTHFSLGDWLKHLLARVMVFPAVFVLLAISAILYGQSGTVWAVQQKTWGVLWAPVALGRLPADAAGPLIAFGILFAIPSVAEAVQQLFEIKPNPLAQAGAEQIKGLPILGRLVK